MILATPWKVVDKHIIVVILCSKWPSNSILQSLAFDAILIWDPFSYNKSTIVYIYICIFVIFWTTCSSKLRTFVSYSGMSFLSVKEKRKTSFYWWTIEKYSVGEIPLTWGCKFLFSIYRKIKPNMWLYFNQLPCKKQICNKKKY